MLRTLLLTTLLLSGGITAVHAEDPRETTCTNQFDASTSGSIGGLAVYVPATVETINGVTGLYTDLVPDAVMPLPQTDLTNIAQGNLPAWLVFEFQHTDTVDTTIPGGALKGFAFGVAYAGAGFPCNVLGPVALKYDLITPELRREILRTAVAIQQLGTGEHESLPEDELARIEHIPLTRVDTEIETYLKDKIEAMKDQ